MNRVHVLEYLLLALTVSYGSNNVYYVIPTTGNQTCPAGQVCHDISYYTKFIFPSTGNFTLVFLEGQHILNDTLEIYGPDNVILKVQGHLPNDHWSTVINCGYNEIRISTSTTAVYMEGLTYINGNLYLGKLYEYDWDYFQYFYMHSVSLQNGSLTVFAHYITITDSIHDNTNCIGELCGELKLFLGSSGSIIHNLTVQGVVNRYIVKQANLSGALSLMCDGENDIVVKLTDVTIANNNDIGILIWGCVVNFGNVTISNNHSPFNGGGMWISELSTVASLPNTTVSFINNTAKEVGGAIYIDTSDTEGNSFLNFTN